MKQRSIEVVVAPDGGIRIEAMGFQGVDCEKPTAFLEQALGTREKTVKKPEFYQRVIVERRQRIGG